MKCIYMHVCNYKTNGADVIVSFHISASKSETQEDFEVAGLMLDKVTIIIVW